jgi:hypothetical protein
MRSLVDRGPGEQYCHSEITLLKLMKVAALLKAG